MGVARDKQRKYRKTGIRGKAICSVQRRYWVKKYEKIPLKLIISRIPNEVINQQKLETKNALPELLHH